MRSKGALSDAKTHGIFNKMPTCDVVGPFFRKLRKDSMTMISHRPSYIEWCVRATLAFVFDISLLSAKSQAPPPSIAFHLLKKPSFQHN